MNSKTTALALVILSAVGAGAWYFFTLNDQPSESASTDQVNVPEIIKTPDNFQAIERQPSITPSKPSEPSEPDESKPEPQEQPPVKEEPALEALPKSLSNSDNGLIEAAKNIAPKLVAWMTPDQQVRKWVFLVDNVADGNFPIQHRPLTYEVDKFQVENTEEKDIVYLSVKNHQRAQSLINVLTQIPAQDLIRYYQHWLPLFDDAYAELGRDDQFHDRLLLAIDNVLAIEPLSGKVALKRPSVFYQYADKDLEAANKLHKFFWRLGPSNTQQVQAYLRTLKPLIHSL